uniref:Uncharacterized protein n=1 Tax=Glossina austeni TaxID=7395 RepID=A0A1A9V781_GLOAU
MEILINRKKLSIHAFRVKTVSRISWANHQVTFYVKTTACLITNYLSFNELFYTKRLGFPLIDSQRFYRNGVTFIIPCYILHLVLISSHLDMGRIDQDTLIN